MLEEDGSTGQEVATAEGARKESVALSHLPHVSTEAIVGRLGRECRRTRMVLDEVPRRGRGTANEEGGAEPGGRMNAVSAPAEGEEDRICKQTGPTGADIPVPIAEAYADGKAPETLNGPSEGRQRKGRRREWLVQELAHDDVILTGKRRLERVAGEKRHGVAAARAGSPAPEDADMKKRRHIQRPSHHPLTEGGETAGAPDDGAATDSKAART